MALAIAFVQSNIGKPHVKGAMGPESYSCLGLVRACEREVFGRDVPVVNVDEESPRAIVNAVMSHPIRQLWRQYPAPLHGDLVEMARHDQGSHVGVFLNIDRGGILHCVQVGGVRFDALQTLPALGWHSFRYWRPQEAA